MTRSLTSVADFSAVRTGRSAHAGPLSARHCQADELKLGFAIGSKFGNAVERNRCRRRVKAAFAQAAAETENPAGYFLIRAKRAALTAPYPQLVDSCRVLLASVPLKP